MTRLSATGIVILGLVAATPGAAPLQMTRVDATAVRTLLDNYERGQAATVSVADVKTLLASLDRAVPDWMASAPPDGRERRRQVVALMVLEQAQAAPGDGTATRELIEWACAFLRKGAPGDFERDWMVASLLAYQPARVGDSSPVEAEHTNHALTRFPRDVRVRLAALAGRPETFMATSRPGADSTRVARGVDAGLIAPLAMRSTREVLETRADLDALAKDPDAGPEAIARLGTLLYHLNDVQGSISWLTTGAERLTDPALRHFTWLNAGLALDAANRRPEAIAAYRHATELFPDALSSSTALAAALFLRDERTEAAAVLDAALSRSPAAPDPWLRHSIREVQFAARLRELRATAGLPVAATAPAPRNPVAPLVDGQTPSESPVNQARPTFRAATSGVIVDVSVVNGRAPVKGLSAADFEVLDEGVAQAVSGISVEAVPIDLTVVVDVGQEFYAMGGGALRKDAEAGIQDLREIPKLLRPNDRYRVIKVGEAISEPLSLHPVDGSPLPIRPLSQEGLPGALYDGVAAALIRPTPADRRHLIVIFTDGIDTSSVINAARLREIVLRSDPVLQVARRYIFDELMRQQGKESPAVARSLLWPPATTTIEEIVTVADGEVRHAQPGESMLMDVQALLDRFRQRYLLQFQPTGVPDTGWHTLTVRLKKPQKYQVKARRGYFAK